MYTYIPDFLCIKAQKAGISLPNVTQNVDRSLFPYLLKTSKSPKIPMPGKYRKVLEYIYKHA